MRIRMHKLLIYFLFCSIIVPFLYADNTSLILSTDRHTNPDIIILMTENGLEPALEIALALGRRSDPYLGDIIEYFLKHYHSRRRYESERILFTMLNSLFPEDISEPAFQKRFEANRTPLLDLIADTEYYETPELRAICYRLIGWSREPSFHSLLTRSGARFIQRLKETGGLLSTTETEELVVFLTTLEKLSLPEFNPLVTDIARYSQDRLIVMRVRDLLNTNP